MIRCLRKLSAKEFFIYVFFLLLILNIDCLCNPPYWDDIVGLHNQAVWLSDNDFNFIKLNVPEQQFWHGGSNIYPFGIIPVIYGVLYKLFPPLVVHCIGHIFNIGCLSLASSFAFRIIKNYSRDGLLVLLWSLAALTEPVMAGRSAALGQECPLIAFMMLIVYMISRHRILSAAILCFLVILFKLTGIILGFALIGWIIIYFLTLIVYKRNLVSKKILVVSGVLAVLLSIMGLVLLLRSNQVSDDTFVFTGISAFTQKVYSQFTVYLPIQALYLLCVIILLGINIYIFVCMRGKKLLLRRYSFCIYLLIFICGFYVAYFIVAQLPRYTGCVIFPLVILLCLLCYNKIISRGLAVFFLMAGLISMHGKFFPAIPPHLSRSGECLERSREYLVDLKANQDLCYMLEELYSEVPILAKWPYVQMLTMAEFRYVDKALPKVYCSCVTPKYTLAKCLPRNGKLPAETVFVYAPMNYEYWLEFGIPMFPENNDKIICTQHKLGGELILYQRKNFKSSIFCKNAAVTK